MDRRTLLGSSAAMAAALAAPNLAFAADAAGPPVARVTPVTETLWGVQVTDPYRWMEAQDAEWKTYTLAQAAYAKQTLDAIPGRDALFDAIHGYTEKVVAVSAVQIGGDNIFTEVRPAGANTFKLYVRQGVHGADRVLIDPDTYATAGSHASLDWWSPSPDGSHVVFGVSPGGSENSVARIMVTATGALLPEVIDRTQFGGPSWTADGQSYFYNRLQAGVAADSVDKFKDSAVWRHKLNTDAATDVKVLGKDTSPVVAVADIDFPQVNVTPGSDYAFGAIVSGVQNEGAFYVAPLASLMAGAPDWKQVCSPADKITGGAVHGNDVYMLTHQGASRYKVIKTSAAKPDVAGAALVVPESQAVIRGVAGAKDALYIQDLAGGLGQLRRMTWDGKVATLKLPFEGSIDALYTDATHDGAWFLLQGWVRPSVLCYAGPDGKVIATDIAPQPPIDISPYTSEETWYTAADGVKVPISLVYKKGLKRDGTAPAFLDAYGAYGITQDPGFLARWMAFLDVGGVFAIAHVRGGGELGEDWHLAGMKLTKPNTWRDTIAAAHFLIDQKYSSSAKIGIMGGSAGGITVGRFMTEDPGLVAVVIDQVGCSNALRMEFSPNGPDNVPEFGSVLNADGFKGLYEMDALVHVKDGTKYPSVMLTTGLNDPRVAPWQPTKMTARLQAATASGNPVILRVDTDAGHGIGSTLTQRDKETADTIAFLLWRTGDPRYKPA